MYEAHGGNLVFLLPENEEDKEKRLRDLLNIPSLSLTDKQLHDLEMILVGGFSPLKGFLNEKDYNTVLEKNRLSDDTLWPIPITLDIPENLGFNIGDKVSLQDKYGNPVAILNVESIYEPDREREALKVFGTNDTTHQGVWNLLNESHPVYLGGSVEGISLTPKYDFKELRYTPKEIRDWFKENKWEKIVGFQTRNPIHRAHFELFKRAAKDHDAKVLIHPVVGLTKEGDIDYITRVRAYQQVHKNYSNDFSKICLLPLAMRMGGPREALWHAIIRKNYGCTHFVVGRDHAGPGKDRHQNDFYGPYEAHDLVKEHENELGINIVTFQELLYVPELNDYIEANKIETHHNPVRISGTEFRKLLREGGEIPEWFSFPEVIYELKKGVERENKKGYVVFFTGLSGAGKSTIANILYSKLLELQDRSITYLDGDIVRNHLSKGLGFSKQDRDANIERIGFVANEIAKHGGVAICSAIAPYVGPRLKNRNLISKNGKYIEVYVSTPIEECEKRDTKGLYKKARAGVIKQFTGIDDPYEEPLNSEIQINTVGKTPEECADIIVEHLKEEGII